MSRDNQVVYNPGDLVLVESAENAAAPYPAVVVAPIASVRPKLMTSVVHAQRIDRAYYWVDTDRLELVQRGGQ